MHFSPQSNNIRPSPWIFIKLVLIILISLSLTIANPVPEESSKSFFKSLMKFVDPDKIPSVELKVGYDGISVSTGPSREQIYWTIGFCIGGFFLGIIILIVGIYICIHCNKRRRNQMELALWNVSRGQIRHVDVPGSFMVLNPTLGTPIRSAPASTSHQSGIFATSASKQFENVGHGMWART